MKTLKVKLFKIGIILLCVSFLVSSCSELDYPQSIENSESIEVESSKLPNMDVQEINETDPIILSLKKSKDIVNYNKANGALLWDLATITKFDSEESLPMINVPIDNGTEGKEISMLVAAYNKEKNSFLSYVNTIDIENLEGVNNQLSYSGEVEFKTTNNELLSKLTFEEGELMEQMNFDLSSSKMGIDMRCFLDCFVPLQWGFSSAGAFGAVCMNSALCCIAAPTCFNPCCIAVAGCLLYQTGAAAYCAYQCNS